MEKLIETLRIIGQKIDFVCKAFLGIQLVALTVVVIAQVFFRTFGHSIGWATEFSTLTFVWASMLGSATASRYMLHIGVDTIRDRLKGKAKEILMVISHGILITGLVIFIFSSFEYTIGQINHMATTMPNISLAIFYCSLPICGTIMLYHTLVQLLEIFHYGDAVRIETSLDDGELEEVVK